MNMKNREDITVGIVAYNTELMVLKKTFESLRSSSIPVNVVVLCNSPSPAYQKEVDLICSKFGYNLFKNRPNRGFGAGHNEIWKSVKSTWYICCNPDVRIENNAIENLIGFGINNSSVGLLMPKVLNVNGTIQPLARQHPTPMRFIHRQLWRVFPTYMRPYELTFDYQKTQPIEFVSGCFFAVKTQTMEFTGGFDESFFLYAEDADLSRRTSKFATNWYVANAVVTHEWSGAWKRNFGYFLINFSALLKYWIKHGNWILIAAFVVN